MKNKIQFYIGLIASGFLASRPGTYTVKLTVFDDRGGKGISTQTVEVF